MCPMHSLITWLSGIVSPLGYLYASRRGSMYDFSASSEANEESSEEHEGAGDEARDDERLKVGKADRKWEGVGATMVGVGMATGTLPAFNWARISYTRVETNSAMILSESQRSLSRALGILQTRFQAQVGTVLR